jgi:hypothetical protein
MPGTPYLLSQSLDDRPPCPACGVSMLVVRIEPVDALYLPIDVVAQCTCASCRFGDPCLRAFHVCEAHLPQFH